MSSRSIGAHGRRIPRAPRGPEQQRRARLSLQRQLEDELAGDEAGRWLAKHDPEYRGSTRSLRRALKTSN